MGSRGFYRSLGDKFGDKARLTSCAAARSFFRNRSFVMRRRHRRDSVQGVMEVGLVDDGDSVTIATQVVRLFDFPTIAGESPVLGAAVADH
jgi:hypothetical protein